MKNSRWYLERIEWNDPKEKIPLPILATRITLSPEVKNGSEIPILILDTSLREDFENYIRFHILQKTGECKSGWSKVIEDRLTLILQFLSPSRCNILIELDLKKYCLIVDRIIQSEALWLYPARKGDLKEILEKKIFEPERLLLVEVPSKEFQPEWEKIFDSTLRNLGLTEKEIQRAKKEWRRL